MSNSNVVGKTYLQNTTNVTSLELTGKGYLKEQVLASKTISNLTISAWIKPDYSQGSPQFTVLSKENTFILAVNNNIPPSKKVIFSLFDGIRWETINSTVSIGEDSWTYLAATYTGSKISLYVNGTLQSSQDLSGIPTFATNGQLIAKTVGNLTSDSDILIGATYSSTRQVSSNLFSGLITDVNLYDSLLTDSQILKSYNESPFLVQNTQLNSISHNNTASNLNVTSIGNLLSITNSSSVSTNSSQPHETLQANNTSTNIIGIDLRHDPITINSPATWVQNVTLTNNTKGITMELPEDAEIFNVQTLNDTHTDTIFSNQTNTIQSSSNLSVSGQNSKLVTNSDIRKDKIQRIEILDNATNTDRTRNQDLSIIPKNSTLASLKHAVPQMIQDGKPLKLLMINETAKKYSVKFQTPAPYTIEKITSTPSLYEKSVTVTHNSTLHYTNVTSYSSIPEDMVKKGIPFKLFWMVNGSKTDVTKDPRFDVKFVDTNNNGIADRMQWTVPKLSQQDFVIEAQITVINVQSYPLQGGNWTVFFNTTGTADLNITAINGTAFGSTLPADLKFLQLSNGTHTLSPTIQGNSIIFHNYSSTQIGSEISHVITSGKHHLMFQFGDSIAYANNNAFKTNIINVHTPLSVAFDSSDNFIYGNPDFVAKSDSSGALLHNSTDLNYFGVAANSTGFTFAANPETDQIDIYNSGWTVVGHIGSSGSGNGQFSSPIGVTVDSSDNIYVADTGNDRVEKFDSHNNYLTTFGSSGTGTGQFNGPMGVAVNSTGYVYVTDTGNNRTEIFAPDTTYKSSFGAAGGGSGNTQFNSPIGIAIDKYFNNVYVADTNNDRIQKFDKNGNYLLTITQGFNGPVGVAVDSNNFVYVADSGNDLIEKFETDLKVLTESLGLAEVQ